MKNIWTANICIIKPGANYSEDLGLLNIFLALHIGCFSTATLYYTKKGFGIQKELDAVLASLVVPTELKTALSNDWTILFNLNADLIGSKNQKICSDVASSVLWNMYPWLCDC